jgi:hypothetical protein
LCCSVQVHLGEEASTASFAGGRVGDVSSQALTGALGRPWDKPELRLPAPSPTGGWVAGSGGQGRPSERCARRWTSRLPHHSAGAALYGPPSEILPDVIHGLRPNSSTAATISLGPEGCRRGRVIQYRPGITTVAIGRSSSFRSQVAPAPPTRSRGPTQSRCHAAQPCVPRATVAARARRPRLPLRRARGRSAAMQEMGVWAWATCDWPKPISRSTARPASQSPTPPWTGNLGTVREQAQVCPVRCICAARPRRAPRTKRPINLSDA